MPESPHFGPARISETPLDSLNGNARISCLIALMIISQTPYRVSFAGGGTDLPAFYRREFGAVLSTTIDQHIYVTIHRRFEPSIRVSYSRTEIASTLDEVQHELVREAMRLVEIDEPLEITTIGDVPVGYRHGLQQQSDRWPARRTLRLPAPGGQPPAAGRAGLPDRDRRPGQADRPPGPVRGRLRRAELHPLQSRRHRRRRARSMPEPRRWRSWSGESCWSIPARPGTPTRSSSGSRVPRRTGMDVLRSMRDLADEMRHALAGEGDLDRFAALLHEGWELKRSLGCGISNDQIDEWYAAARRAGAVGGKLLGPAAAAFLLLMAPPWRHRAIREALGRPRELPFRIARHGSRNIFIQN